MAGRDTMAARAAQQQALISSPLAVPPLLQPTAPAAINRTAPYPSTTTIGGAQIVTFPPFTSTTFGQIPTLQQIGYWKATDQVPRPVQIKIATTNTWNTRTQSFGNQFGVICKVTIGNERGSIAQWYGAPCIIPAVASYVRIEATMVSTPFILASFRPGVIGPETDNYSDTFTATLAVVINDHVSPDDRPGILLPPVDGTTGVQINSPCILDQVVCTNTNASATVLMAVIDSLFWTAFMTRRDVLSMAYISPQSSLSLGSGILGTVGAGVILIGLNPANLNGFLTEDSNDNAVFSQVYGRFLLPGSM
jgi:hypothetical protein